MICNTIRVSLFKREKNPYINIKLNLDDSFLLFMNTRILLGNLAKKWKKTQLLLNGMQKDNFNPLQNVNYM